MSYEKTNWSSGDVITAEKLNKIESGIESSTGYETTETREVFFESDITTKAGSNDFATYSIDFNYQYIPDVLYITFNGVEYLCKKIKVQDGNNVNFYYGGKDTDGFNFIDYPFVFVLHNSGLGFITKNAGTYTFKIENVELGAITTPAFDSAVNSTINRDNTNIFIINIDYSSYSNICTIDKTFLELYSAPYEIPKVLVFNGVVKSIESFTIISYDKIVITFYDLYVSENVANMKQYTFTLFKNASCTMSTSQYQWNVTSSSGNDSIN